MLRSGGGGGGGYGSTGTSSSASSTTPSALPSTTSSSSSAGHVVYATPVTHAWWSYAACVAAPLLVLVLAVFAADLASTIMLGLLFCVALGASFMHVGTQVTALELYPSRIVLRRRLFSDVALHLDHVLFVDESERASLAKLAALIHPNAHCVLIERDAGWPRRLLLETADPGEAVVHIERQLNVHRRMSVAGATVL